MRTTRSWAGTLEATLTALLLVACAPRVEGAGPPVVVPALEGDGLRMADGVRLPLRVWPAEGGAPKAIFVALHGFNDYGNAFDRPATYWAKAGITTYAYDQRGFGAAPERGLWPGTETLVDDLRSAIALIGGRHPGVPLYVVGESMGGAVAMVALAGPRPPGVAGVVLAAPAVWGWRTMNPFYRATLWLGAHIIPWSHVSGRGMKIKPSDNRDMLIALARDPLTIKETRVDAVYGLVELMDRAYGAAGKLELPILFLYGDNDQLVPREPTLEVLRRLRAPRRVRVYPSGFHMLLRDLDADMVLGDIVAWVNDPTAPLPSGNEPPPLRRVAGG